MNKKNRNVIIIVLLSFFAIGYGIGFIRSKPIGKEEDTKPAKLLIQEGLERTQNE